MQIETDGVELRPGLPQTLQVLQTVDLSIPRGLLQDPLTLDLHLLQLKLFLWKLSQSSLMTNNTAERNSSQFNLNLVGSFLLPTSFKSSDRCQEAKHGFNYTMDEAYLLVLLEFCAIP